MACKLCTEFRERKMVHGGETVGDRILFEAEDFVVVPAVGQISEGYVLIATREHYCGMGSVPASFHPALERVQEITRSALRRAYSTPLFFEHGPAGESKGGCCIDHAHIHAIPVDIPLVDMLSQDFPVERVEGFFDVMRRYRRGQPYFFVEDQDGGRFLFDVPDDVPSQYIRMLIAEGIGKPERWDWKTNPGLERVERTYERLKGMF